MRFRLLLILGVCLAVLLVLRSGTLGAAQPVIVTNTPAGGGQPVPVTATATATTGAPVFITFTPDPSLPTPTVTPAPTLPPALPTTAATTVPLPAPPLSPTRSLNLPPTSLDQYALRLWREPDLVGLLLDLLAEYDPRDMAQVRAVQLTLYELERRFPGAPRDLPLREQLVQAMLSAPPGSLDLRAIVRPYILLTLEAVGVTQPGLLSFSGFQVRIDSFNLDAQGDPDALIHAVYSTPDGVLRYDDYFLAAAGPGGVYRLLSGVELLPAAPLRDVRAISVQRVGDVNADGVDELALVLELGVANRELLIFSGRSGSISSLIVPGQRMLFGQLLDWSTDGTQLRTINYRYRPSVWNCIEELPVNWGYSFNYYRVVTDPLSLPNYTPQNSPACQLDAIALFTQPPAQAINTMRAALPAYASDSADVRRARMVLAMLYVLNGQPDLAEQEVATLEAFASVDNWLAEQIAAYRLETAVPNSTPVELCAALQTASQYGACDLNQLLARLFTENPLRRTASLTDQLRALGIPVLRTVIISEVGRIDREAVNIAPGVWWSFAPLSDDFYTAAPIPPPPGYELRPEAPAELLPSADVYDTLLVENDPAGALLRLQNQVGRSPDVPVSAEALYLSALCYDLLGDRGNARSGYYGVWSAAPDSIWGRLAAAHLERVQ